MNGIVRQMLSEYPAETPLDRKNALKEVVQEIVLCGLSRAGFFKHAAFYGGTALRIFYGLNRFSEDLDFSLIEPDENFDLESFFPALEREAKSYGLNVFIKGKIKSMETGIRSAFLKAGTLEHLLMFYPEKNSAGTPAGEVLKIKFEVDVNPPAGAGFERKYRLIPAPFEVNLYDMPSLFAGKLHAVICRAWKNRVKGRDLYDFVFYRQKKCPVNLVNLRAKLVQSNFLAETDACRIEDVKRMLCDRFDSIDFTKAKRDILPFVKNASELDLWSADFFKQITDGLSGK